MSTEGVLLILVGIALVAVLGLVGYMFLKLRRLTVDPAAYEDLSGKFNSLGQESEGRSAGAVRSEAWLPISYPSYPPPPTVVVEEEVQSRPMECILKPHNIVLSAPPALIDRPLLPPPRLARDAACSLLGTLFRNETPTTTPAPIRGVQQFRAGK